MSVGLSAVTDKILGFQDFVKILTTELLTQDPFEPFQSESMINQMTAIQTYESIVNLSKSLQKSDDVAKMTFASSLIGKVVTLIDDDGNIKSGVVNGVILEGDQVKIVVEQKAYGLDKIVAISNGITATGGSDTQNFQTNL
jgi:flagellar basal-body rod modification protein FlgD